jgi:DNA repair protein RadC
MTSFKKVPISERPKERLARLGESSLSLAELFAILLGSGTKTVSVLELAQNLVAAFPDLEKLADASMAELLEVKGIGKAKAVQLKAALALAKRLHAEGKPAKLLLNHPQKVASMIEQEMDQGQEKLMVILRNAKGEYLHREIISVGTVSEVLLHPREIFHVAVKHRASSIIIAHNHPSGDPTPSLKDIEMTRLLQKASLVMAIPLVDHLVISKNRYVSLGEMGVLEGKSRY